MYTYENNMPIDIILTYFKLMCILYCIYIYIYNKIYITICNICNIM